MRESVERVISRKRIGGLFLIILALFFTATSAIAQELKGKLGVGVRGGPSVLTQNAASISGMAVEGNVGPIVSGSILYGLSDALLVGIDVEWGTQTLDISGSDIGDSTTYSIMTFIEDHAGTKPLSPYILFGLGANINALDLNSTFNAACKQTFGGSCNAKLDTTLAFKVAGGIDYFVIPNLALNTEVGYIYNSGNMTVTVPVGSEKKSFNGSVFSALFGIRYFFGGE